MQERTLLQAAALAAIVAFLSVLVMGFGTGLPADVNAQPGPGPLANFVAVTNDYHDEVLIFFAGDSLFILSYLIVFVGLYTVSAPSGRSLALVGMGAGILTAILDASENAFYITYALSARDGVPLTEPALPLIHILTNLKWMTAFATLYASGLLFPRQTVLAWVIAILMLIFPLFGVMGVANPNLVPWRGLFFLVGMPLFAAYFGLQARQTTN